MSNANQPKPPVTHDGPDTRIKKVKIKVEGLDSEEAVRQFLKVLVRPEYQHVVDENHPLRPK